MAKTKRRVSKKKKNNAIPFIIAVAAILVVVGALIIFNQSATQVVMADIQVDYPTGITEDGQPFKGGENASVVIEEYSDFGCPHCADFAETLSSISDEYIKTGKIKVIFRNFVLSPATTPAAKGSECALQQGSDAFWAYHDAVFANQSQGDVIFSASGLKDIAQQVGLDAKTFNTCLDTNKTLGEIQKDSKDGEAHGINSTPTLYFNGEEFLGAMPEAQLKTKLDGLLSQ